MSGLTGAAKGGDRGERRKREMARETLVGRQHKQPHETRLHRAEAALLTPFLVIFVIGKAPSLKITHPD